MTDHNQHLCVPLSLRTDETSPITVEYEEGAWLLRYRNFATDDDVRDGEADEVGETLTDVSLAIHYCPFCGRDLRNDGPHEE